MNLLTTLSALGGLVGVALGAFGAHALSSGFDEKAAGWWETATFYLLVHAVAALVISFQPRAALYTWSGFALILGAMLFAATLYAMALGAPRWLGAVTPLGGTAMIAGWGLLVFAGTRSGGAG